MLAKAPELVNVAVSSRDRLTERRGREPRARGSLPPVASALLGTVVRVLSSGDATAVCCVDYC